MSGICAMPAEVEEPELDYISYIGTPGDGFRSLNLCRYIGIVSGVNVGIYGSPMERFRI